MYSLGKVSKTTFLIIQHAKVSIEFVAAAALKEGQPVKLNAVGDVVAWAKADGRFKLIGYCATDAANGDMVTVLTRGYIEMFALSNAACDAGPATWEAYDAATAGPNGEAAGYNKFGPGAADADSCAWNLVQAAGADELIRVLLME